MKENLGEPDVDFTGRRSDISIPQQGSQNRAPTLSVFEAVIIATVFLGTIFFLLAIFYPAFHHKFYLADDLGSFTIPLRYLYAEGLHAGRIDIWMPSLFYGLYEHAEGQMGMLHPFHLFLYKLVPFPLAFSLELLTIYLALYIGSYSLFYEWVRDRIAASFGAFVFTFGGPNLFAIVHVNRVAIVAHIPWMMLALHRCFAGETRHANYWFVVVALLNGSAILLGYPYFFLLSVMFQLWYVLYLTAERVSIPGLIRAASGVAIGLLIGAAQWIPTLEFLRNSRRARPTFAFISVGSLSPWEMLQWANPYFFRMRHLGSLGLQEIGIYAGIGPLLLFIWWLCRRKHGSERRLFVFLLILALIGLFLSFGEYNGLFVFYSRLPGFREFRGPCRYILFTMFAFAAASAVALKQLMSVPASAPSRLFNLLAGGLGALSVATVVLKYVFVATASHHGRVTSSQSHVIAGSAIVCLGIILLCLALCHGRFWLTAFCVFAICDITIYSATYLRQFPVGNLDYYQRQCPPLAAPARVMAAPYHDELILGGYQLVNGYAGLEPNTVHPLTNANYLAALGVAAVQDQSGQWSTIPLPSANAVRFEQPFYSRQPIETMNHVDLTKMAVVTQQIPVDTSAVGSVKIIEQHPGFVHITAESSGRMLCVLIQRFDPGWTGSIGNQKLHLLPVDGDLTGFVVSGGRQDITLEFRPRSLAIGESLSYVALLFVGTFLLANWIIR